MTKHTPGPWQVDKTYGLIMAGNEIEIAACHAGRGADAEANARLIAAAPEMLDALEKIESCLSPDDNDIAAKAVRHAIAKAKGLIK